MPLTFSFLFVPSNYSTLIKSPLYLFFPVDRAFSSSFYLTSNRRSITSVLNSNPEPTLCCLVLVRCSIPNYQLRQNSVRKCNPKKSLRKFLSGTGIHSSHLFVFFLFFFFSFFSFVFSPSLPSTSPSLLFPFHPPFFSFTWLVLRFLFLFLFCAFFFIF